MTEPSPTVRSAALRRGMPLSMLRPERSGNAFEQTVERIAEAIKLGVFQLGDRLPPERELAELMQVSRMTLREALGALRDAGFVETRRGRSGGTYVVYDLARRGDASAQDVVRRMGRRLDDALEFRRVVEPGAAALAAVRGVSDADRQHLEQLLVGVERAEDDAQRRVADSRLHLAVALATGSESLTAAVADVQVRLSDLLAAIPVLGPNIAHSDRQHREIVAAIVAGDADRARAAMLEHCDATSALLRGLLG